MKIDFSKRHRLLSVCISVLILSTLAACGMDPNSVENLKSKQTQQKQSSAHQSCKKDGDLNGDNRVDLRDALKLINCLGNDKCIARAKGCSHDINNDGAIDSTDLTAIIDLIKTKPASSSNNHEPIPQEQWPNGPACEGECEPNGGGGEGEGEEEEPDCDQCGVCDYNPYNDCVQDCAGTWGGNAVDEGCGCNLGLNCTPELNCNNGNDDNDNGLIDCSDPDCYFETHCLDPYGNDFLARGELVPQGISIRIDEGSSGFDALESIGEEFLDGIDLMEGISNPVYSSSWGCWDTSANISSISFNSTSLDIDPQSNGQIKISGTVTNFSAGWSFWASAGFPCGTHGFSGSLSANATISIHVTPSVQNGSLSVSLSAPSFSYSGFNFNISNWPNWLEFDGTVEDKVIDAVQDTINDVFSSMAPGLIEGILNDIQIPMEEFHFEGNTYHVSGGFSGNGIDVDDNGVTFELDTFFGVDNWVKSEDYGSSLVQEYATNFSNSHDVHFALGDNHINKGLYALWGGGAFDVNNIDFGNADGFFGCNVNANLETLLPPRTDALTNQNAIKLYFDAVKMHIKCGGSTVGEADLNFNVRFEMNTSNGIFTAAANTHNFNVNIIYPSDMEGQFLEPIISHFVNQHIEDALEEMFSSHPLPEVDGFDYSGFSVSTSNGHINMSMNLDGIYEPPSQTPYACCGGNFYDYGGRYLGSCSNLAPPACGCPSGAVSCPCNACQ
jgi:hypothetical protein